MTVNQHIRNMVSELNYPVFANTYTGLDDTYFVFNYNAHGDDFADDSASHLVYFVQLHFYCPITMNTLQLRSDVMHIIASDANCWFPDFEDASDEDTQHLVFEFQLAEAWI